MPSTSEGLGLTEALSFALEKPRTRAREGVSGGPLQPARATLPLY